MIGHGFIPVFGAFQRIAHFFPQNNDIFYLSSNLVSVSKNELTKLRDSISNDLSEIRRQLKNVNEEYNHYLNKENQQKDAINYYENQMKELYNNYVSSLLINNYSNNFDFKKIQVEQIKLNSKQDKQFSNLLQTMKNNLQHTVSESQCELRQKINRIEKQELEFSFILDSLNFLVPCFTENAEDVSCFEIRLKELVRYINKYDSFKRLYFDFYIKIKSQEQKLYRKTIVNQMKKMINNHKMVMKMKKNNKSVNDYINIIQEMEQNKIEIDGLLKDYDALRKNMKGDVLKFITGYKVKAYDYKLKPFYEKKHQEELLKVDDKLDDEIASFFGEVKEMDYYAKHKNASEDEFFNGRDLESKYHNALIGIKIARAEEELIEKLSQEVDPDEVDFIDNEVDEDELINIVKNELDDMLENNEVDPKNIDYNIECYHTQIKGDEIHLYFESEFFKCNIWLPPTERKKIVKLHEQNKLNDFINRLEILIG